MPETDELDTVLSWLENHITYSELTLVRFTKGEPDMTETLVPDIVRLTVSEGISHGIRLADPSVGEQI